MATCPSTPPRRTRVITPDAPLFAPGIDEEGRDRKGKKISKDREPESQRKPNKSTRGDVTPKGKSTKPAVSFASPPCSPKEFCGLLSPSLTGKRTSKKVGRATNDDIFGSSDASTSATPLSTNKFKKFKGTDIEGINNPFKAIRESMGAGSLLTPSKTPSMKRRFPLPVEGEVEEDTVARNLFQTPKKSSSLETVQSTSSNSKSIQKKKLGGVSGNVAKDLFGSADILGPRSPSPIQIFTDTNAKVPEYDPSPENPFVHHPPEAQRMIRSTRSQKKIEEERKEVEEMQGNREDGMVYKYRGQTIFRKFEKDNSSILGGGLMRPRVLFPSSNKTPTKPTMFTEEEVEDDDEFDAFSAISKFSCHDEKSEAGDSDEQYESAEEEFLSKTIETSTSTCTSISAVEEVVAKAPKSERTEQLDASRADTSSPELLDSTLSPEIEDKAIEIEKQQEDPEEKSDKLVVNTDEDQASTNESSEANIKGKENQKLASEEADQAESRGRAPSVAPSVSSVASSNILSSFTRRPRITKSVSNLSNSECVGGLRRSKRLLSVEPLPMPAIKESDKTSIKHKLSAKRGRSEDVALEETEKWALGIAGGIRKRVKNHDSA